MTAIPLHEARRRTAGAAEADTGPRPFAPIVDEAPVASPPELLWYGDAQPEPPPFLIEGLLPQKQVAVAAGQAGAGKTFIGIDLSVCVMTGEPFVDHAVKRPGAVLWLAAEGHNEVAIRLKAALVHRFGEDEPERVPFAQQAFEVPTLTGPDALSHLIALVDSAKTGLAERFPCTDLVLIVVDTLNSAAGFDDENSASETQKVMNLLRRLSDASGALVLVIDHYGKTIDTGIRGSSAKIGAADAVLAVLADRTAEGETANRRLAVVKLRSAPTGEVVSFKLRSVPVDTLGNTHCGIEWTAAAADASAGAKGDKPGWTGKARILKTALERAMLAHGQDVRPWGSNESTRRAVPHDKARAEFYASYAAESQEAKKKAFQRATDLALSKELIVSREIGGVDWFWFVHPEAERPQ